MEQIESLEHNPMRAAHEAPRCQHIRHNGRRCAAPAQRGQNLCHFHKRIQPKSLYADDMDVHLPFIEDATSLQFALMRVMRTLLNGDTNYKACSLLLYGLQIACTNLKNFMAERPELEHSSEAQPKSQRTENEKAKIDPGKEEDETLAGILLRVLAKPDDVPSDQAPEIKTPADYYAAMERKQSLGAASLGDAPPAATPRSH